MNQDFEKTTETQYTVSYNGFKKPSLAIEIRENKPTETTGW